MTSSRPAGSLTATGGPVLGTVEREPGAILVGGLDLRGTRVRRLDAGGSVGGIVWDGTDDRGRALAPGIYLVRCLPGPAAPLKVLLLR